MRNGLDLFTGLIATFMMDVPAGTMTSGRTRATAAAAVGLVSLIIGGLAFLRSAGLLGKVGAFAALVLGLIGTVLTVIHLTTSTSGIGTGSGVLGAIVGLVMGLIGMSLGGLAIARARRAEKNP